MEELIFENLVYTEQWFSRDEEGPGGETGVCSTFGNGDLGADVFGNAMEWNTWYFCIREKISKAKKTLIAKTCGLPKLSRSRLAKVC